MEACIIDGTKRCGAVSGLTTVVNPISLARLVMEKTPHIYLAFDGAEAFAREQGVETVDSSHFITPENVERLKQAKEANRVQIDYTQPLHKDEKKETPEADGDSKLGTVGCVAVDSLGNLASATSTGGLVNKMVGRIGDTPIIGAGTYANSLCAVSATGKGEAIIRGTVARDVAAVMEFKYVSLKEAAAYVVEEGTPNSGSEVSRSGTPRSDALANGREGMPLKTLVSMTIPQTRNFGLPFMNLIRLKGIPILQQLHLEEQLLRTSSDNWCIMNDGTKDPTIVMGISGKPAELLEIDLVLRDQIPVIRRFTGGGTVIVDHNTVFVTFICNTDAVAGLQPYPRPIMSWSSLLYSRVFEGRGDFQLRENDYVFGNRKFGGNAQSITKTRWIHHTSFLWDYEVRNMAYLRLPKRIPEYRLARDHLEFICCLKDYIPRSVFLDKTVDALRTQFSVRSEQLDAFEATSNTKFVPSTRLLTRQELEEAAFGSHARTTLSQSLSL